MTRGFPELAEAGPLGPVCIFGACSLLLLAPLMRGGNRHPALIVLEAVGLLVLLCIAVRCVRGSGSAAPEAIGSRVAWSLLWLSPILLAAIYLVPLPIEVWLAAPGRNAYLQSLRDAGAATPSRLPLSLVPQATLASLLAGVPLLAGLAVGRTCTLSQLKLLAWVVVLVAFAEVLLGLLQISGGPLSPFYFGGGGGRPIGTFANSNHFANYLCVALTLYIWLACVKFRWSELGGNRGSAPRIHAMSIWASGGVLLVLGVLMSRSRGAVLAGLLTAVVALAWAMSGGQPRGSGGWRSIVALVAVVLAGTVALLGVDAVISRFAGTELASSASFRNVLAQSTIDGAREFWPWGAGWGVYGAVYPRFQPPSIPGAAGHAHQDYAEMLFEGGIFFVVLAGAFLWLAASRIMVLRRVMYRHGAVSREAAASVLCGLGLLGFLLHSLVDFNMRIPANALLACLLAGVFLRPLVSEAQPRDRPA